MGSLCGLKWGGRCFIKDWVRFWMGFKQNIVLPPNLANFWYSSTSKSIKSNKSTWGNWRQEQYEVDNEWFSFLDQFFPVRIEGCLLDIKQSFQVAVIFFPQWIFKDNLLRKNFREVFIFNKKLFSFSFLFQYPPSDAAYPPTVGGYPHPASGAYPPGGSGYPPAGGAYPPQPGFSDAGYGGGNFKSRRKYKPTIKPPEHNVKLMSFSLVTLRQVKQIFKKRDEKVFILFGHYSLGIDNIRANSESFLFHHKSPFRDKFRDIFISP